MFLKRFVSLTLVAAALFTSSVAAAFDSAFKYSYTIADSATYTRYEGKNSNGLQRASYIQYTPGSSVKPMVVYAGDAMYGSKSTITAAQSYLQNQGYSVLGGINADFFVLGTSIPIGLVIKDGTLISSDAWQYAVGFLADGSAIIGQPSSTMKVEGSSGAVWCSYFNKSRTDSGIYLLDSDYDDETHISSSGKSIVFERVDSTPVTVGGSVKMKVISKGAGSSSTTITKNQMVLSIDDDCKATWVDYPIGEEVTLTINAPDARWSNVRYAVGGKSLVKDGTVSTSSIDSASSYKARTALGVKSDGTVVLYEIDGAQSSLSVGLTAKELGNELLSMGCNNVICLDGGGSSAMTVRIPGESTSNLVTSPSDGSARKCANYIFLVNTATSDGVARHVHMRPSYYYILPNASTYFAAWGSDSAYTPATLPSDMTYTASSGTVDSTARVFYADDTPGNVTISGTSADGTVTGSHTFCVTTGVTKIALTSNGSSETSYALRGGTTLSLDASAYHFKTKMASSDNVFQWSVSGNIGTIDANGLFTAYQQPASGTITCQYGSTTASVKVTVGLSDPPALTNVADFEQTQPFTSENAQLSRTTELSNVASGTGALQVTYSAKDTADLTVQDIDTSGRTVLTMLAKAADSNLQMRAIFADSDGNELTVPFTSLPQNSYSRISVTVPSTAVVLKGLRVESSADGNLYLDHIMLSAKAISNTAAPSISWISAPTSADTGASVTVSARISMANGYYVMRPAFVTAYVDGVKSSAVYSASSGTISVPTGALTAGLHQVTITAVDDAGNVARKSVSITAGTSTASAFTDTSANWANGYINFAAKKGLLKGQSTQDGTMFYPSRNLTRGEFAVILARYLNLTADDTTSLPFSDVSDIPSWSLDAIAACYQAGIMNGQLNTDTNETSFTAGANITRAEAMTAISKCLPRGFVSKSVSFSDNASIPSWAASPIQYAIAAGIVDGYSDGSIRPTHNITRAEISKILCALY